MASVKKENNEISAATLRTMPNNFEAEQAVLGAIMSDKDIANEYVANLSVDDFYTPINAIIFERIEELNKASKPTDIVMVSECLAKTQQLDAIGGFSMLADMLQNVFSTANCAEYVKILKQNSLRRNLIRKCNEIIASAYKLDDAEKVLAVAESLIYSVAEGKDTSTLTHVRAASTDLMQLLNMQFMNRSGNSALKVGFENLDEMTGGFVGGQLIILAARPGCGKTSFAMNIAANIAREQKEKVVAIFNLEMSARELAARLISNISRTDSEKLKDGTSLLIDEFTPLWKADAALGQSNIYIDDTAAITVEQIMSKCRRLKSQKGALDLVIVDYMQLMESSMPKATKQQQVSEISRKFKVLAKELKVPVIVLSQMSRDIENREKNGLDATPKLSDLRDSGTIEQDADMVFFLTKGDFELSDKQQGEPIYLIVAKQRNGSIGELGFCWNKPYTDYIPIKNMLVLPKDDANKKQKQNKNDEQKNDEQKIDSGVNSIAEGQKNDNNASENIENQTNVESLGVENVQNDTEHYIEPTHEQDNAFDPFAEMQSGDIKSTPNFEDDEQ